MQEQRKLKPAVFAADTAWEAPIKSAEAETYRGETEDIERILTALDRRSREEQEMILDTVKRYNGEAEYKADTGKLVDLIEKRRLVIDTLPRRWVDLGAGAGDLVAALARTYARRGLDDFRIDVTGFDLSPGLVRAFNKKLSTPKDTSPQMRMGLIDDPYITEQLSLWKRKGGVSSILTLDRVANPRQLIRNMSTFEGAKLIGTLLPIVPEDDNPSRQENKIIYTPVLNRITPGKTREEDLAVLKSVLEEEWNGPVETAQVPYVVESSGDRQEYMLDVFFTRSTE